MSENYPRINTTNASKVHSLYQRGPISKKEFAQLTSGGFDEKDNAEERIATTINRCFEIYEQYTIDGKNFKSGKFDHEIALLFHKEAGIQEHWARDPGFWVWLTFFNNSHGAHIIDLRFPKKEQEGRGKAKEEHYGLRKLHAGLYAKCWIHAEISIRALSDYSMLEMTDVDFWDSHVLGADYGLSAPMAHAFYKVIKEKNISRYGKSPEPFGYRALAIELTRLRAFSRINCFGL